MVNRPYKWYENLISYLHILKSSFMRKWKQIQYTRLSAEMETNPDLEGKNITFEWID